MGCLELFRLGEVRVTAVEVVVTVALDRRGQLESGRTVLEGQAKASELDLDFVDGLRSEVTNVEQVRLAAPDELTHRVDALALQAVVRPHGQVELLDRHRERRDIGYLGR